MQLKSLIYTSRARLDLTDDELNDIHQAARHLNALDAITGLLAFDGLRFLQVIEGAEDAVDDLVERLRRDPRHSSFEIRDERIVAERSFPDWSMELVRVSAGFREARKDLSAVLPDTMSPDVRDYLLELSERLATHS